MTRNQVRQMFDERRQRVAGIDKGYPLQPIQTRVTPNASAIGPRNKIRVSNDLRAIESIKT